MDISSAASTLRLQLITLQHCDRTVSVLEREVTSLNEDSLMTAIDDNTSRHLRLLLRLSVTDGVHQMYQQYSAKKWTQIQNTAKFIKSQIESDNGESGTSFTSPSMRQQPDKAADQWSSVFCELSRHE